MAYDEGLAQRVRDVVERRNNVSEKKMFGGIAWMLGDKMFVGIVKDQLMVRVGKDANDAALKKKHVTQMDFTGKPMKGYVYVSQKGLVSDADIESWVEAAAGFVKTL